MNVNNLEAIGIYLHGPEWKTPLAVDLGVNARTMRRWAACDNKISTTAWDDLITLAACRYIEEQAKLTAKLSEIGSGKLTLKSPSVMWDTECDNAIKAMVANILHKIL